MFLKINDLFIRFDSIQAFKKAYKSQNNQIYAIISGRHIFIKELNNDDGCNELFEFLCEKLVESTQNGTNCGIVYL